MSCRQCRGIERQFGARLARIELARYRKLGPPRTTRILLDALQDARGKRVLDVGGGVGAIQHELARAGAGRIWSVEASPAYLGIARAEAKRLGYADRVQYRLGDFVDVADEVEPADVVTLDRVICCYDDMPALIARAAEHAQERLGIVYPRDSWWMHGPRAAINGSAWIRRCPFRFYLHQEAAVQAAVQRAGFRRQRGERTFMWNVEVYCRTDAL